MPRIDPGWPRGLVSVLRPQRCPELHRRPGGSRPFRLRRVRDPRGRSQGSWRRPQDGHGVDPCLWPNYRRCRLDCVVRSSRAGELDNPHGEAHSPCGSRGSQSDSRCLQARRAVVPDRSGRRSCDVARRRYRSHTRRVERILRARILQATRSERRGHAAGSTCRTCEPTEISPANTWTPMNLALLVERLGGAILVTHSQSGIMGHHMARVLKERGHLDLLKGLITLEGSCSLSNSGLTAADFDSIPYLALKGDYTATSMVCQETVNAINARRAQKLGTAKAEYLKLDEMGILGVTHMMMLDKKNLEIADILYNWIGRNARGSNGRRSTQ